MAEIPQQLIADAAATEDSLTALFADIKSAQPPHLAAPRLIDAMAYAALGGGKRLRAALVLGSARLAAAMNADNPAQSGNSMHVAMAFECLHAYSLIHDDLPAMDDAETRRGKPSCHLAFDEATAVLAGDTLQTLAFELLARPETHPEGDIRAGLVMDLARASGINGMAGGQMLDLEAETRPFDLDETKAMQSLKTGALIRAAAVAGGRVGGGSSALLAALETYADKIGLAFQIADDVLDRTVPADQMGKPTGRDDDQGKASYVAFMGLEGAIAEADRLVTEADQVLTEAARNSGASSGPALDYMLKSPVLW